ncbi:MAG: KAP family NTPase, partial [archaeon]|nr:KAP family NTPase [archaeon]
MDFPYDKPIEGEEEDKLNRMPLARYVSEIILSWHDSKGSMSIGICGDWGSGKTSFINLVKNRCSTKNSSKEGLSIIEFNPWIYTTQSNLTEQFFSLVSNELYQNTIWGWLKSHVVLGLKHLSMGLIVCSKYILNYELYKDLLRYLSGILGSKKGTPLHEIKRSISKKLTSGNRRFLIIIDDLDRLKARDIRMIMQLVKSMADFPNIIYLLGYDENIVSASLSSPSIDGREYLQKIVNLPITLPKIEESILHNVISDKFEEKYGNLEGHTAEVLKKCIFPFIKTLRDVNALFSRFDAKFVISENNTHPADLLAITLLEFKNPKVWNWVYCNRHMLCSNLGNPHYFLDMHECYANSKLPEEYCDMLSVLFPHFKKILARDYDLDSEYRIASPVYVDNYFLLSLPRKYINNTSVQSFLCSAKFNEMVSMLNSDDPSFSTEFMRRAIIMYSKINTTKERKRHLSDFALYFGD